MLIARFSQHKKPKVFECVCACRRITRNIHTGFENRQRTPTKLAEP